MQKTSGITINLAKNRGETLVDRVIAFSLTIGRILIICTELVALGAFLYRFSLDQTLVGLHDTITQQEAIVNLLHDNETKFRNIQGRLQLAATLAKQSSQLPQYLLDIENFTPADMDIHSIAVAPDGIRIEASAQSIDSLTTFVDKLKAYPPIQTVSIDQIDNKTQIATITVTITAILKQSQTAGGLPAAQGGTQ